MDSVIGPFDPFIQADLSYRSLSDTTTVLQRKIDKKVTLTMTVALTIESYYLQFKYLLPIADVEAGRGNWIYGSATR